MVISAINTAIGAAVVFAIDTAICAAVVFAIDTAIGAAVIFAIEKCIIITSSNNRRNTRLVIDRHKSLLYDL